MLKLVLFSLALSVISASYPGPHGPITQHFQSWLTENGYGGDSFARTDYGMQGSFGGKTSDSDTIVRTPVIFIHGNSDSALQTSKSATGWTNSIQYFLTKGYKNSELYATSWGDNIASNAAKRTHNCNDVSRLRRFIQAVLAYTKASKVSLVTHSMGVTLMRKAIRGGEIVATDGNCNLGAPLQKDIEVYLGLAGANYGLCNCEGTAAILEATCNKNDGLWSGDNCGLNELDCGLYPLPFPCKSVTYSKFLMDMNQDITTKEGSHIFSAWSHSDDLIMYNDYTWGRPTSLIPNSDGKKIYLTYTHMETKELTAEDQYTFVHDKTVPA